MNNRDQSSTPLFTHTDQKSENKGSTVKIKRLGNLKQARFFNKVRGLSLHIPDQFSDSEVEIPGEGMSANLKDPQLQNNSPKSAFLSLSLRETSPLNQLPRSPLGRLKSSSFLAQTSPQALNFQNPHSDYFSQRPGQETKLMGKFKDMAAKVGG